MKWIGQQQAERGDYAGARETLSLANAAYPAQASSADDIEAIIAEGQFLRGEMEAARATINGIKSADMRSSVIISGVQELLDKGDEVGASAWLEDAMRGLQEGPESDFCDI